MPSILLSSDSPSTGRRVARDVASALGYDGLGREFLAEVAKRNDVPEDELVRALDDYTPRPEVFTRSRTSHLACIQEAVLERFLASDVVCEGLCAHLYVRDIPHVLNVRILDDVRLRTNRLAAEKNLSPRAVRKRLERLERRRQRWSLDVFQVDEASPANYDLVISLGQIEVDQVVKMVCDTVRDRRFQEMTYSRKCVEDSALASRVRAKLIKRFPGVRVGARDGAVTLRLGGRLALNWRKKAEEIRRATQGIAGVDYVEVHRKTREGAEEDAAPE